MTDIEQLKFIHELSKDVSSDELISILKYNVTVASDMRKKCEMLSELKESEKLTDSLSEENQTTNIIDADNDELTDDLEDLYAFYYRPILEIDSATSQLRQQIIDLLPDVKNKKFFNIVGRIQLELFASEKEFLDLLSQVKGSLSGEDFTFSKQIEDEIAFSQQKRKIIEDYVSSINQNLNIEDTVTEFSSNHLIYLPTMNGNLYVNNDLLAIPTDYYSSFRNLFISIQNGTFKGFKRLVGANNIVGVSEVKDYQSRIVFDRIGPKSFVILDTFVKKVGMDKEYMDSLAGRVGIYRRMKSSLVQAIQDPDYIQKHDEFTEDILNSLDERNREKIRTIGKM